MKLYRRSGSPYWWFDFTTDGIRRRESTGRTDKEQAARVMAREYEAAMDASQFGTKPEITVADAFGRVLKTVEGSTHDTYAWASKRWLGTLKPGLWSLPHGLKLHQINQGHLDDHLIERRSEGLRNNSVNLERSVLKLVIASHSRRFRANSDLEFTMAKAFVKTRFLTLSEQIEVENLLMSKEGPSWSKALDLFVFVRGTGARLSEALNARWDDLDLTNGLFEVYRIKTESLSVVPLPLDVVESLKRRHNQPQPFESMGQAVLRLREAIDEVCNKDKRVVSQRGKATIHTLRDTYGSSLVRQGMSLHELAKLLGHTTAAMSAKYAHLETQDVVEKARKMLCTK